MENFWYWFGIWVFTWRIADGIKYKFITQKICKLKNSRGTSRKFLNISLGDKVFLTIWAYFKLHDWVITVSCLIAIWFQLEALYYSYLHYPYKNKKKKGWKRPSFWRYIINSITPNKYAKRL